MQQTEIFVWNDRAERVYVRMRGRGSHWRVEWGWRDPQGSSNWLEQGHHETSVGQDALETMLAHIRALAPEPDEVARVEPRLRAALAAVAR